MLFRSPMVVLSDSESGEEENAVEDVPIRVGIPTVVMSDSEVASVDDDSWTQWGRDPQTGRFTADSFSFVEDAWLE